ncbi:NTP transferase domain-containing protein [Pseudomonadota bacterium]
MKVLILAAGIGSRLGSPHPKPLTVLSNGRSILQHQVKAFLRYFDVDDVYVVVGFKKELIMEAFSELTYVYNDYFDTTNTSKSLQRGLRKLKEHDVLWTNGDVVFDHQVLAQIMSAKGSCMAVNTLAVGEEEVKYTVDDDGYIDQISKTVNQPLGEAVGINKIDKEDAPLFLECLEKCSDSDYFEKGIELAIAQGLKIRPLDVKDSLCIEVDFVEDLKQVNQQLDHKRHPKNSF